MNAVIEPLARLFAHLQTGGPVMMPLVGVSVVMWTLILNRALYFRRLYGKNMSRRMAGELVQAGTPPDPAKYRGATSLLVTEFLQLRSGDSAVDRSILDETVIRLNRRLDRHLGIIGVLAGVAPLLGLLGTVTGMISTFDVISLFGTGNARAMAGGISEALITTQTGLFVAIPGLYMWNFLTRRAQNLKERIASLGIYLKRYV